MGAASASEIASGMGKVKYSWALIWLEYPPCEITPLSGYGAP